MKKFVLYARKSTESDERQIQSIDDQINYWTRRAQELGDIEIVRVYTEERSAKEPGNRPEFEKMFCDIKRERIDGVLCWKLDRLTRNPVDSGKVQYALQRGRIERIITSDREYRPEDSGLIFSVETGMANQYILDLSRNTKRGMEGKIRR
jgi:DNA invertase Pin-like site-specific DNA recombinase